MDTPNFDLEIEALLEAKINYHKEQAKFHAKMAAQTKDKLRLLIEKTGYEEEKEKKEKLHAAIKTLSSTLSTNPSSNLAALSSSLLSSPNTSPLTEFSVTIWKPKVEKVLKDNLRPFKTEEILREIAPTYLQNDEMRKKAIGVISSSLFSLVQNQKVIKMDNEGNRGNLYIIANQ